MLSEPIDWRVDDNKYGSGYSGFVGKIRLFELYYSKTRDCHQSESWKVVCMIGGFKEYWCVDEEEAKDVANEIYKFILQQFGIKKFRRLHVRELRKRIKRMK